MPFNQQMLIMSFTSALHYNYVYCDMDNVNFYSVCISVHVLYRISISEVCRCVWGGDVFMWDRIQQFAGMSVYIYFSLFQNKNTLRVHDAQAAANLNSGYSKYTKVARVHYF